MDYNVSQCDHCGDACRTDAYRKEDKHFCCRGCLTVYELLTESGLEGFYADGAAPGIRMTDGNDAQFAYLDEPKIQEMLLLFKDDQQAKVRMHLPAIHCSSCLWLLEHLNRLHAGVLDSSVNFSKRQAMISFDPHRLSLRALAELLQSIGYTPQIDLSTVDGTDQRPRDRSLVLKIGITGFLFGNIMLLSFPEYLSTGDDLLESYRGFFTYLILAMSFPVLGYGAKDFFTSSIVSLRHGRLTIDVPIAIGISVIFLRSVYEIMTATGHGYLDSMAGLVFFLLIGRWYQSKVYDNLSFERDFRSFFPLSAVRKRNKVEENVPIMELEVDDYISILSQGVIPADCVLLDERLAVDYSFVTGESRPFEVQRGESIYAGGRNLSGKVSLRIKKKVSQSYLTALWNQETFTKKQSSMSQVLDQLSARFTAVVLIVAACTTLFWRLKDTAILLDAVTAVLIVACPCALALSVPFALGNARRLMTKHGLFSKNTGAIEQMAKVDTIIFDKTGTLTHREGGSVMYDGLKLSDSEQKAIAGMARQSAHPHSRMISTLLGTIDKEVFNFEEINGAGIQGIVDGLELKIGSAAFVGASAEDRGSSASWLSIDGKVLGCYEITRELREGIDRLIPALRKEYHLILLSGDNNAESSLLSPYFEGTEMHFEQSPTEKLEFVKSIQESGKKVMMIGDGLNDAGALSQADIGVAIADDLSQFTPACDAILQGASLKDLPHMLAYSKRGLLAVKWSVALSLLYNVVGVSYAVQGLLTPLIAAILMPLSSVTVVGFATLLTGWYAKKIFREKGTKQLVSTGFRLKNKELELINTSK